MQKVTVVRESKDRKTWAGSRTTPPSRTIILHQARHVIQLRSQQQSRSTTLGSVRQVAVLAAT